tara:strand:+ start:310 stop:675 length:366 start_codon:yes stop_codon:yes gene_type:complete
MKIDSRKIQLPSHVHSRDVEKMFALYKKYKGKDDYQTYKNLLGLFFHLTMDPYVFGDLHLPEPTQPNEPPLKSLIDSKYIDPDGTWKSSRHSLMYWGDICKKDSKEINRYYKSVNNFATYS